MAFFFSPLLLSPASDIQRYTASVQGGSLGYSDHQIYLPCACLVLFQKSLLDPVTLTLLIAGDFILSIGQFFSRLELAAN